MTTLSMMMSCNSCNRVHNYWLNLRYKMPPTLAQLTFNMVSVPHTENSGRFIIFEWSRCSVYKIYICRVARGPIFHYTVCMIFVILLALMCVVLVQLCEATTNTGILWETIDIIASKGLALLYRLLLNAVLACYRISQSSSIALCIFILLARLGTNLTHFFA